MKDRKQDLNWMRDEQSQKYNYSQVAQSYFEILIFWCKFTPHPNLYEKTKHIIYGAK